MRGGPGATPSGLWAAGPCGPLPRCALAGVQPSVGSSPAWAIGRARLLWRDGGRTPRCRARGATWRAGRSPVDALAPDSHGGGNRDGNNAQRARLRGRPPPALNSGKSMCQGRGRGDGAGRVGARICGRGRRTAKVRSGPGCSLDAPPSPWRARILRAFASSTSSPARARAPLRPSHGWMLLGRASSLWPLLVRSGRQALGLGGPCSRPTPSWLRRCAGCKVAPGVAGRLEAAARLHAATSWRCGNRAQRKPCVRHQTTAWTAWTKRGGSSHPLDQPREAAARLDPETTPSSDRLDQARGFSHRGLDRRHRCLAGRSSPL